MAIVVISFFRIFWLQFIIAGIGVSIFEDTSAMSDYFLAHPQVLRYSVLYFIAVIVISIVAFIGSRQGKKKKALTT